MAEDKGSSLIILGIVAVVAVIALILLFRGGLTGASVAGDDDDDGCSPGFTCIPGGQVPEGFECELENDDDGDGVAEPNDLKECELNGVDDGDDDDDGICCKETACMRGQPCSDRFCIPGQEFNPGICDCNNPQGCDIPACLSPLSKNCGGVCVLPGTCDQQTCIGNNGVFCPGFGNCGDGVCFDRQKICLCPNGEE